jgi:hypothetical protein
MSQIFAAALCPLMAAPAWNCEQVDELLPGWSARLLEPPAADWALVRTDYGYLGYAPVRALSLDRAVCAAFAARPKGTVTRSVCQALAAPSVRSWPVARLVRGAVVAPLARPDGEGWVPVALPDGRIGYTKCNFIGSDCNTLTLSESDFRPAVARTALSYLGAPYRWGGKSPLGVDCSGLAFLAYRLNGVTICRDARLEPGWPVRPIPAGARQQGDLLYFPGHVAVYLGGDAYVHATARTGSDGVVVNSLDPASPRYRADLAGSLTAVGSLFGVTEAPDSGSFSPPPG